MTFSRALWTAPLCAVLLAGCGSKVDAVAVSQTPDPITTQECDACGMVVIEQPAPRGQVIYRDGTHAHFCSLGDMLVALDARSPHGSAQHVYVEALPADLDPAAFSTGAQPWIPAAEATYVSGVVRERVMGAPLLSYRDPTVAASVAAAHHGTVVTWDALRQ